MSSDQGQNAKSADKSLDVVSDNKSAPLFF